LAIVAFWLLLAYEKNMTRPAVTTCSCKGSDLKCSFTFDLYFRFIVCTMSYKLMKKNSSSDSTF